MAFIPLIGFPCHHVARTEPEMFIHGPKMAGAKAASVLLSTFIAKAEAIPPFCNPTSIATVRQVRSSSRTSRESQ